METNEEIKKTSSVLTKVKNFFSAVRLRFKLDPLTATRVERFFQIRRAKYALYFILVAYLVSLFAELFISNRALVMMVDGKLYFPTYGKMLYADDFNFKVKDELELNYREFAKHLRETKRGWALLPPIPYSPYETDNDGNSPLSLTFKSSPVLGFAIGAEDDEPGNDRTRYNWVPIGEYDGFKMSDGTYTWIVFGNSAEPSILLQTPNSKAQWVGFAIGKTSEKESENASDYVWHKIGTDKNEVMLTNGQKLTFRYSMSKNGDMFHPLPPSLSKQHILGTDTIGRDIFARIIYGFRLAMSFSLMVAAVTYFVGILIGIAMGYFGGMFDIIAQRFIEVWERIPYLYMVIILSSIFKPTFFLFVLINIIFSWTGKTWTMRAMTYREREHDYILAARSMGASVWRIITVHILPNIMVVIVTSLPFVISGGIGALTSLDYLGYGLQPPTPSWGELLSMGTQTYQSAPWILTSIVVASVFVLVMIAFVGEWLREAFDPKRFTVYK